MIKKAGKFIKKLEIGILEFFIGLLMVIGIIGYFYHVPADLDWLDHTISFILFSVLFYHASVTSILFGQKNKKIDALVIISFFLLFFKDILAYTKEVATHFTFLKFIDGAYFFLAENPHVSILSSFYLGLLGLVIASVYITKNTKISHPSFLFAIKQKPFSSKTAKFLSVFMLLFWFYFFVYNLVLEWLEFTLDDPIIVTGIVFFAIKIAKRREKFHKDDFIFKIGEFSEGLYKRFISLFHHKKTIPVGIAGLLILHALTDLGVFSFSLMFGKENLYIGLLEEKRSSFIEIYASDSEGLPLMAKLSLIYNYSSNMISFIVLLIIPIAAWFKIFSQKELHFKRAFLPIIYASITSFILLPAYSIIPLDDLSQVSEEGVVGIDIPAKSLLETHSVLNFIISSRINVSIASMILSILMGILVYFLSSIPRIKKELYAVSIFIGLFFYTGYIYYFFVSFAKYLYSTSLMLIFTPYFLMAASFMLLLLLSIVFYIGGYLMFIYELIMEYHKRKWSDPIDEELVKAVSKLKSAERKVEMYVKKRKKYK